MKNSCLDLKIFFMTMQGLHWCTWTSSSCGEQRLLSSCGAQASHCSGFSCCSAWAIGHAGSVVMAHKLSCPMACGIFLDQGSTLCPLHWQMDS